MTSADARNLVDVHEVRTLARGSGIGILGTALSQLSLFVIVVVLAAARGTAGVGIYSEAFAIFTLLGLLSLFGMQTTLTRYIAMGMVSDDTRSAIRRLIAVGTRVPLTLAFFCAAIIVALAPSISEGLLQEPRLVTPLRIMALAIPPAIYARAAAAALQGFGRVRDLAIITTILEPSTRLVLTVVLVFAGFGVEGAAVAILVSNLTSAVWAHHRLRTEMRERLAGATDSGRFERAEILRFTVLTSSATIATNGLLWADTILLGAFLTSSDVGVYQVATRILALATLATGPIAQAFAPRIADLIRRGDFVRLRAAYSLTTVWSTRLAVPAVALCVVAPGELAHLVGGIKGAAVGATLVLAVGKLVEAATGPCGMVLNMSDRVGLNAANNAVALVLNIALNLLLIPAWGLVGAATAWSIALVVLNLARSYEVHISLDLSPDNRRVLTNVLLGLPALLVGWLIVHHLSGLAAVPVAALAILMVFALGVLALDWTTADTEVVHSLLNDRGRGLGDAVLRLRPNVRPWRSRAAHAWRRHVGLRKSTTESFKVAELVSPLRLDVLVRADFFVLIRRHRELITRDWDAFMELARGHAYYTWFAEIAMTELRGGPDDVGPMYDKRVRHTVEMLNGWDHARQEQMAPIQIWKVDRPRPTASGKLVKRAYYLGDGCHRLALLILDGVTELSGAQVHVRAVSRFAPRDNTSTLLSHKPISDLDYLAFVSSGYGVQPAARSRAELINRAGPDNTVELETVLSVDDTVRRDSLLESRPDRAPRVNEAFGAAVASWEGTTR